MQLKREAIDTLGLCVVHLVERAYRNVQYSLVITDDRSCAVAVLKISNSL